MILATISTRHYDFTALGHNEQEALDVLLMAWARHCDQVPDADPSLMAQAIEDGDVNLNTIAPGVVLRDGSPI